MDSRFDQTLDLRRRRSLAFVVGTLLGFARGAFAGAQLYEPLADSVRSGLAAQIADSRPPVRNFDTHEERMAFVNWLDSMSQRLRARKSDDLTRLDFLRTLDYEATRAGLDRQLVLGLIQVESGFRKYAISNAGARGYMQVMPFWTRLIGDGDARRLFDMRTNLRYGCVILRHYLDLDGGDLFLALGRYNGSRGKREYPDAVIAAWKKTWSYEPPARTTA
ncbi:MAG TPA: lytic transglycosylase domain-containing protein [Burkholderiaceae bacterium]|nr:lytic transglycosylase domain-containing protein [Burkholderiaceae bacterium]